MSENEDIKKAKEELDKINQDAREKELARLRMKHILDQKAIQEYGYDEGMKDGVKHEKIEIAKNLLKIGLSIEQIIQATSLSKEKIEKISKE